MLGPRILPLGSKPLLRSYCCTLLLHKATLNPQLLLLSTSGQAGIYVLLPARSSTLAICKFPELTLRCHNTLAFWGPRYPLGYTGVLGSFDKHTRADQTYSCLKSHTHCYCRSCTNSEFGYSTLRKSLKSFYFTWCYVWKQGSEPELRCRSRSQNFFMREFKD